MCIILFSAQLWPCCLIGVHYKAQYLCVLLQSVVSLLHNIALACAMFLSSLDLYFFLQCIVLYPLILGLCVFHCIVSSYIAIALYCILLYWDWYTGGWEGEHTNKLLHCSSGPAGENTKTHTSKENENIAKSNTRTNKQTYDISYRREWCWQLQHLSSGIWDCTTTRSWCLECPS